MPEQSYGTYDPADMPSRKATAPQDAVLTAEDGTELPRFDARFKESFKGLVYIGALTDTFSWLGHEFVIRTLVPDEQLAISLVVKQWVGTQGEQLAYITAVAAMATISVDGEELPSPIGEDTQIAAWAHQRFNFAKSRWYDHTIGKIFERYLTLEDTARQVVDAMGKALGPATSTPGSSGTSA